VGISAHTLQFGFILIQLIAIGESFAAQNFDVIWIANSLLADLQALA
jgi:hypothetical protein